MPFGDNSDLKILREKERKRTGVRSKAEQSKTILIAFLWY